MAKRCIPKLKKTEEQILLSAEFLLELKKALLCLLKENGQLSGSQLERALDAMEDGRV